jgi:hypothetical protein
VIAGLFAGAQLVRANETAAPAAGGEAPAADKAAKSCGSNGCSEGKGEAAHQEGEGHGKDKAAHAGKHPLKKKAEKKSH